MDFLNDLAEWTGGLRASATKPVYQMRMELADEMKRREIGAAFDQVVGLRQQLQDQGETFGDEQKLKLFQQMKIAGIDPQKMASTSLEELREQAFSKAMGGIDNPYALGNLANKLDVAPTKHVGGVTYNRFDPTTESILHMTEAVRADGRKKTAEADKEELTYEVLSEFLKNEENSPILKVDAANDKPVTKHDQAVLIDKDGNRRNFNMILQPDGSWAYTPAADQSGNELRVPSTQGDTSLAKNMALMASKLEISDAEALKILTNTRQKSKGQLYEEAVKMAVNSPKTGYGSNAERVKTMADDLFRMMRPNEELPGEMVEQVNQGGGDQVTAQAEPSSGYASAEDVKAAYSKGSLTREQALSILRKDFGYQ